MLCRPTFSACVCACVCVDTDALSQYVRWLRWHRHPAETNAESRVEKYGQTNVSLSIFGPEQPGWCFFVRLWVAVGLLSKPTRVCHVVLSVVNGNVSHVSPVFLAPCTYVLFCHSHNRTECTRACSAVINVPHNIAIKLWWWYNFHKSFSTTTTHTEVHSLATLAGTRGE